MQLLLNLIIRIFMKNIENIFLNYKAFGARIKTNLFLKNIGKKKHQYYISSLGLLKPRNLFSSKLANTPEFSNQPYLIIFIINFITSLSSRIDSFLFKIILKN